MDKVILKFLADVLYVKEKLCLEEYEAILDVRIPHDLDKIIDRMLSDDFNTLRRGESYGRYGTAK